MTDIVDTNDVVSTSFIRPSDNTNNNHSFTVSNELNQITSVLQNNICCGIYEEYMKEIISHCPFSKYEQMFNFLVDQKNVKIVDPTYSMYKASLFTGQASHHINIQAKIGNSYYTTIQADDKFLFLNCLSVESLMEFLFVNSEDCTQTKTSRRYVYIPVIFSSEVNEVGHHAMIIFDVIEKLVYFADPNGTTSFYDNIFYVHARKQKTVGAVAVGAVAVNTTQDEQIVHGANILDNHNQSNLNYAMKDMYINTEPIVENMFKLYIDDFNNATGSTYSFVPRHKWNPRSFTVNKSYKDAVIGSGHCVALSTMIANYCHNKKSLPIEIYELLSKLSQFEIIELINSYSLGLYNVLIFT